MREKKAFSLIELVIVMLIVGILATVAGSILVFSLQDLTYLPNKLNTDMLAQQAIDEIVDGDNLARGLRFSRQVVTIAANSITYIDENLNTVVVTLNTSTNKLSRTINAAADTNFLYYAAGPNIAITVGRNGALFLYYNSSGGPALTADNVRSVEVNLIAKVGSGLFSNWQGQSEQSSLIKVNKFQ